MIIINDTFFYVAGFKFSKIFKNSLFIQKEHPSYKDLLAKLVCPEPKELCYSQKCVSCPKISDKLQSYFDENGIDEVNYKKWTTTDRCTILDVCTEVDEFIDTLIEDLKKTFAA